MMIRITILYIFITSSISAINPPQQGTIPDSVLQLFRYQEIGDEYGNPGWIKKLQRIKKNKQNRNEQLYFNIPVLLGKYSRTASINISESGLGSSVSPLSINSLFQKFLLFKILDTGLPFCLCLTKV